MTRFIYRFPLITALILFLPVAGLVLYLLGGSPLTWQVCVPLAIYAFLALWLPEKIASRLINRAAHFALEYDCDPVTFLNYITFLASKKNLSPHTRLIFALDHATGLDSLGRYTDALFAMKELAAIPLDFNPMAEALIEGNIGVVSLHAGENIEEVPAHITRMELLINAEETPPSVATALSAFAEDLRDAYNLEIGKYDGLLERYVAKVEEARLGPSRRRFLSYCMSLATLYDKIGRPEEAERLYGYVVENGNRLGIVKKAARAVMNIVANRAKENDIPT